jgi:hypothetical protein
MLCQSTSYVRSDEKRLDSPFGAGKLIFDQANGGEMTYVLDLSDKRICPVCCFDLDQRIATGGMMSFSFGDPPMKASRPRKGSQGTVKSFFRFPCGSQGANRSR